MNIPTVSEIVAELLNWLRENPVRERDKLMAAIDNLTAAINAAAVAGNAIANSINNAVVALNTPHPTDTQIQAAADAVTALTAQLTNSQAQLDAAVAGPAPAPAPAS